jgi:hypothetical protein
MRTNVCLQQNANASITQFNVDHLPVYNPAVNNVHYDMLIKKVEVNPVDTAKTTP